MKVPISFLLSLPFIHCSLLTLYNQVTTLEPEAYTPFLTLDDQLLFLTAATGPNYVLVHNVSNPASPVLKATYTGHKWHNMIFIDSGWIGICSDLLAGNGLSIRNFENLASPAVLGTYSISGAQFFGIALSPDQKYLYLCVTTSSYGLKILNIQDLTNPTLVATYNTGASTYSFVALNSQGTIAYVTDSTASKGIQVINVANPTTPSPLGTYAPAGAQLYSVILSSDGNYLFVSDLTLGVGVRMLSLSNPNSPTLIGNYYNNTLASFMVLSNNGEILYFSDQRNNHGLYLINISQPTSPQFVDYFTHTNMESTSVALSIDGTLAYATDTDSTDGFYILSLCQLNFKACQTASDCPDANYICTTVGICSNVCVKQIFYSELSAMAIEVNQAIAVALVPAENTVIQGVTSSSTTTMTRPIYLNMVLYLRYLQVEFPPVLIDVFNSSSSSGTIGIPFPPNWEADSSLYQAPSRFSRYNIKGLFLANFWEKIVLIFGIGFVSVIAVFFDYFKEKFKKPLIQKVINIVNDIFVWNFLVNFFIGISAQGYLNSIIELQSVPPGSPVTIVYKVSMLFNFLFAILTIYLWVVLIIPKTDQIRIKLKGDYSEELNLGPELASFRFLYQDYKIQSRKQIFFLMIFTNRVLIFNLIITLMGDYPAVQLFCFCAMNCSMSVYLIKVKPYRQFIKTIENLFYEGCLLFINTLALAIYFIDSWRSSISNTLGVAICYSYVGMAIGSAIFTTIELGTAIYKAIQEQIEAKKVAPLFSSKLNSFEAKLEEKSPPLLSFEGNGSKTSLQVTSTAFLFNESPQSGSDGMSLSDSKNQLTVEKIKNRIRKRLRRGKAFLKSSAEEIPESHHEIEIQRLEIHRPEDYEMPKSSILEVKNTSEYLDQ